MSGPAILRPQVLGIEANEAEVDSVFASHTAEDARSFAGAWADLNWEEAIDTLDQI